MLKVTILDKPYYIRNEWQDNTIKHMTRAQDYINCMPKWLSNYIYSDKPEPVSDLKLLDFYIDWIELFSDIPREFLESEISVNKADEISLIEIFNITAKFLGEPSQDDIGTSDTIKLLDKEYKLINSVKTAGGIEKMLGGATYKHFAESQALSTLFQSKQYRKWSYLSKITAILFRESEDEQYNEDVIDMRASTFENLTVSEAYKGYFFLRDHINKLQESMLTSLTEKKVKAQEQKVKPLLGIFTGKIKPIKLLKKVFLTKKNLLL
tara:strand:+ start:3204 stop:4001 length:798 start_codon:yes stop_codon:yes gene_type:complete